MFIENGIFIAFTSSEIKGFLNTIIYYCSDAKALIINQKTIARAFWYPEEEILDSTKRGRFPCFIRPKNYMKVYFAISKIYRFVIE